MVRVLSAVARQVRKCELNDTVSEQPRVLGKSLPCPPYQAGNRMPHSDQMIDAEVHGRESQKSSNWRLGRD